MALINCPECGKKISDKAERCPHCGVDPREAAEKVTQERKPVEAMPLQQAPMEHKRRNRKTLWMILVPLILIGVGVAIWVPIYQHKKAEAEELARLEQMRRDSIAAAEAELARLEQLRQDSIEWVEFTSPDLAIFNMHGHVKSVKGNFDDEEISEFFSGSSKKGYEFSYDGVSEKAPNNSFDKLIYDDDGYIIKGKYPDDFGAMELIWTKDRKLKKIDHKYGFNVTKTTFNYDDEGNVKNVTYESLVHGVAVTTRRNYKILEKDKFGNWIKMSYNQIQTIDYSGYEDRDDVGSDKSSGVMTREITYYTDDSGYPLVVKE